MRWLWYLFRAAWANLRTNRTTTAVAIVTTAFTLACVGIFLLSYVNLRNAAGWLQEDIKIIVYLDDRISSEGTQELEGKLKADRMVAGVLFISKEQALGEFRAEFPSDSHLLEGLGENPLPASFVVTPASGYQSPDAVSRWAERARTMAGVAKVDYNQEWIDALAGLIRYIELTAIGVGVILSAAAVTIIGNTIRLALFARREEIEILRLIGATRAFIRIPYFLEGAVLGACGSALALGMLKLGFELFRQQISATGRFQGIEDMMSFFPLSMCLAFVVVGMGLGVAGSVVSLRRFGEGRG
ncbi:MAG: ABC transporter permease [Nitrospira sp.]|nr:ABC transporter permease [Nitrospira sp.]MDH4235725.1 ABC transporter permease [Nitrospira sp.]MDH4329238.1 ABC transporter permease [Nitrospira sp.]MDH5252490.1 ABC transporter permease [Nitrospira sp.]MDH5624576.1 ABC transporter permease [Nitrospira sp.]